MHEAKTALLDILVDNSVIVPKRHIFVRIGKDGLLAELQARSSRSYRFCCFFPHAYHVSLSDLRYTFQLGKTWSKLVYHNINVS